MKICPKCQSEYDDEFAYCAKCGVPLEIKPQEYFCPTCGKLLGEKFDSFCPYCGQSFVNTNQSSASSEINTNTVTTVINKTARKEESFKTEIKQKVTEQSVSVPDYNGKWFGFKGRIIRKDYVSKVLVLSFISMIIMLVVPYLMEKTNLIYNLKYFTSYYDFTYFKSNLYDFVSLGVVQIIISILLFGLTLRRFRDMGKSKWIVIGLYIFAMVIGCFLPKIPYIGNIIVFLLFLYGCFGKSIYEDENLRFNNKFEESNLQYACYGVVFVIIVSLYSIISTHNKYAALIEQAMSPNGYWVNIEDTCFIRIPALNKNSKGIPAYQKPGIKKVTLKEVSTDNALLIASGNTGTKVSFRKADNDYPELSKSTVYSSDILKVNEEDREERKKHLAEVFKCSIDDIIVNKSYKPEKLGSTYALVLDYVVKKKGSLTYCFINKQDAYYLDIDYLINDNNEFQELDIRALKIMAENVIWKI